MSATNLTKNLKLPQFVASDKPSWLGDVNGAMLNIDNGIGTIKSDITKANDTASSAKSQSDANTVTLGNVNTELESIGNRVTALEAGGGTEQLEQKVKTNTDDIEALQTRADTFEDEIAANGSKISANTKSITDLTPRVKSCEDNITTLQTSNTSILTEIENLHSVNTQQGQLIATAQSDATSAKNRADSAYAIANTANTNANKAITTANNIPSINSTILTSLTSNITTISMLDITSSNKIVIGGSTQYVGAISSTAYSAIATFTLPKRYNAIANVGESSAFTITIVQPDTVTNYQGAAYYTVSGDQLTLYAKGTTSYSRAFVNIGTQEIFYS